MTPHEATPLSPDLLARRFDLLDADTTEYALFLVDTDGRVLCWNRGAERLFGYRTDEGVGQHFSFLFTPEEVISGQPERELRVARADGHTHGNSWHVRKDAVRFLGKSSVTVLL